MITDSAEKVEHFDKLAKARQDVRICQRKARRVEAVMKKRKARLRAAENLYDRLMDDAIDDLPLFESPRDTATRAELRAANPERSDALRAEFDARVNDKRKS